MSAYNNRDVIKIKGYEVTIGVKVTDKIDGRSITLYCHPQATKSFHDNDMDSIDSIVRRISTELREEGEVNEFKRLGMLGQS